MSDLINTHLCTSEKHILTLEQLKLIIKRVRVCQLLKLEKKYFEIQDEVDCSAKFIAKVKKNCSLDNITSFIEKHRSGRPKKYQETEEKKIIAAASESGFSPRKRKRQFPDGPSRTTIRRVLSGKGFFPYKHKLSSRMCHFHFLAREQWAKLMESENVYYWKNFLFTDSKIFRLDGGYNPQNQRIYLQRHQKHQIPHHQKDKISKGIHVYGGMSAKGLTELIKVTGSVTARKYVADVLPNLVIKPQKRRSTTDRIDKRKLFDDTTSFVFEQDHASSHDAEYTQNWLESKGIDFLDKHSTPSKLDDLWPIERLWAIMSQEVYQHPSPTTLSELEQRVFQAWTKIKESTLRKLVHEIPSRIKAIAQNKGGRIDGTLKPCDCDECQ